MSQDDHVEPADDAPGGQALRAVRGDFDDEPLSDQPPADRFGQPGFVLLDCRDSESISHFLEISWTLET